MLLNVHSAHSLRYGTIPLPGLVDLLMAQGHRAAVLTDINNTSGALDYIYQCQQKGFFGLVGAEIRNGDKLCYICVAKNNEGFAEINRLITRHYQQKLPFEPVAPDFLHVTVIYPFVKGHRYRLREFEYIGVSIAQLNLIYNATPEQKARMVACQPVTMAERQDYLLHCQLRAVAHNELLSRLTSSQAAGRDEVLLSADALEKGYEHHRELLDRAATIFATSSFQFDFTTSKNKRIFGDSRAQDFDRLRTLAYQGLAIRYGTGHKEARQRVDKELEIILKLDFCAYFLITWDMVRFTQSEGYPHVGRGSGANSIVAYCLFITNVCPIALNLYFERFLNPGRKTPPDFDVDYSHLDREQVFKYIFDKYGRDHTAMLGTMSTFKDRSIIRELAKVYGISKPVIDVMIKNPAAAKNLPAQQVRQVLAAYARIEEEFPNQRSVHSGGVVISDKPLYYYTAMDLPPMNYLTTHFDMYTAEMAGFEKLDILSQRGMSNIKTCMESLQAKGITVCLDNMQQVYEDSQVKELQSSAATIGCFYVESPSMRSVLSKLKSQDFLTLVAASSIIRPGVGSSGMMDAFLWRYHHPSEFEYLHPIMAEHLKETFGVMVYQEDVLRIGIHYGGLSPEDADFLRRIMSGKERSATRVSVICEKFFSHAAAMGYPEATTQEIWRQMESFARYSFSKAHSASFAVESYQCMYLKSRYPLQYMASVINNRGGFYPLQVYVQEARRLGGKIHLPCINRSLAQTTISGDDLFLGFDLVTGIEYTTLEKLLKARLNGTFADMASLVERTGITLHQLQLLIRVGGLRSFGIGKKTLLWQSHQLCARDSSPATTAISMQLVHEGSDFILPDFEQLTEEDYYDEMILLGIPVTLTHFQMLKTSYRGQILASEMDAHLEQRVRMVGYYIIGKHLLTKHKQPMMFGSFFDPIFACFDTVHFYDSLKDYPLQGVGVYLLEGVVKENFGQMSLQVIRMAKLAYRPDPRSED